MIPRKLTVLDAKKIIAHLCTLKGEDRRLRFGAMPSDDMIESYVTKSFDTDTKWFGIDHINGSLVAACHVAVAEGEAELGCSVDSEYRGHGYAQLMFDRAVTWLRTRDINIVYMHCLTENQIMRHIAKKNEMVLDSQYGETDATVEVAPGSMMTKAADAYLDRIAFYDMIYKSNIRVFNSLMENASHT